jgi:hypothetical protein
VCGHMSRSVDLTEVPTESGSFYVAHQLYLHLWTVAGTDSERQRFSYVIYDGKGTKSEECFEISYIIFNPQKN